MTNTSRSVTANIVAYLDIFFIRLNSPKNEPAYPIDNNIISY